MDMMEAAAQAAGTQQNGQAGSSTGASIANAAMQSTGGRSRGASPAMVAMNNAGVSYRNAAKPATVAAPPPAQPVATPEAATPAAAAPAPGTNAWGHTVPQPGQPAFPGGPPAPVAGGGWNQKSYATPYGPESEEWLDKMQSDVRASQAETMNQNLRGLRASMAAMPGMAGSGASAAAVADLYRRGGLSMQEQLSGAMLGQYGDERNRLAQAWAKEGDWAMGRDTARMQAEAAQAAASASSAGASQAAELQYKLGMSDLELRRELGLGGLDVDQSRVDYDYYRTQMDMLSGLLGDDFGTDYGSILDDLGGPGWEAGMPAPTGAPG